MTTCIAVKVIDKEQILRVISFFLPPNKAKVSFSIIFLNITNYNLRVLLKLVTKPVKFFLKL